MRRASSLSWNAISCAIADVCHIEDDDVASELVVRDLCDALDEREAFLGRQAGSPVTSADEASQGIRMDRSLL
jgi:hypothetical protein